MKIGATAIWAEPPVQDPPLRGRADHVLAAAVAVAVVIEAIVHRDLLWRPVAVVFGLGLAIAMLFRRSCPLATAAYGFGGIALIDVAMRIANTGPFALQSAAVVVVLAFALFRWASGRHAIIGSGVMVATFAVTMVVDYSGVADAVGGIAILLFTAALGLAFRYRAASQAQQITQAKLHEREQIARELHDTVAHHVSAIAIQAQAGLLLARASSLDGATQALETIDAEAAKALAEMRTMVSALRDQTAAPSVSPQRGVADIESLASSSAPLRVDVEFRGLLNGLRPAVEAALFRVAQESVTNAQRHAQHATRVAVTVTGSDCDVHLLVHDDGLRSSGTAIQPGYGIIGMTERVTLLGGSLEAGPAAEGGWRVVARLPREGVLP